MEVPAANDPVWTKVLTGKATYEFEFLAIKLALGRLTMQVKREPTALAMAVAELRSVFVETARLPPSQRDLARLTGK